MMTYQIPVLRAYVEKHQAEVHVVHWDHKKLTPYRPPQVDRVTYYDRSRYAGRELRRLAQDVNPSIAYITAWQDKGYLPVARMLRQKGVPVVAGFDDQWKGSIEQRIASLIGPCLLKRYFSHAWVAGPYQYEYARRLGFKKHEIVFNLLSGNTAAFDAGAEHLDAKESQYPRRFLYVGRFTPVKGIDILVEAFECYRKEYHGDWELTCVGNGDSKHLLEHVAGIEVVDFSRETYLVDIARRAGVFVLPSRSEPWGVVVHEFASAGMPMILSENVGARSMFLVEGFNGMTFRHDSSQALARAMHRMSTLSAAELTEMGRNSHLLSKRLSPEMVASSFMSVLDAGRN
jgi:glycosyltransferase involved in cell wall biosynthesis